MKAFITIVVLVALWLLVLLMGSLLPLDARGWPAIPRNVQPKLGIVTPIRTSIIPTGTPPIYPTPSKSL